jgi:hypothetical protein
VSKASNNRIFSIIKVVLPLLIGVYLLWHFYNAMDENTKDVFFKAIEEADYFWIIISLILGFFSHIVRAYRWKYMLEAIGHKPKFWHRYHALMIGYIVNLLIPRAGEATRAALLYRTDRISFSSSFGTIIAERVFDLVMLGLVVLAAVILSFEDLISLKDIILNESGDKEGSNWFLTIFASVIVGGTLLFFILWWKLDTFRTKFKTFIKDVIKGVFSIFKSKNPGKFIFYTLLIWALYMTFFGICFYSFEETTSFPLRGILIGYIAGTLGIIFTNGGVGAYPYLVGVVVTFYMGGQFDTAEESEGIGKALGMIIWLSQTVGMIILGLISLVLLPRNYKKEKDDKVGASTA